MQAPGFEYLRRLGAAQAADGGNPPGNDPNIRGANSIWGGDSSAPDQKIECFTHWGAS
jgi:hypothetical protein